MAQLSLASIFVFKVFPSKIPSDIFALIPHKSSSLCPPGKEGVQHLLAQLDGVDISGLHLVHAGHVILLLASLDRAAEQEASGTTV